MTVTTSVWMVVGLAALAANLPFLSNRFFFVMALRGRKSLGHTVFELLLCYFVVGGIALALEQSIGQIYGQGWEFYAVTAALFLTLAFPGFVFRYLRRR